MNKQFCAFLFALFFINAIEIYGGLMPDKEYQSLPVENMNTDIDTDEEIFEKILTIADAKAQYIYTFHLNNWCKYATRETHAKGYKYKLDGNRRNVQITRSYSKQLNYGPFERRKTVRINKNNFSNDFEKLRKLSMNPTKNKLALSWIVFIIGFIPCAKNLMDFKKSKLSLPFISSAIFLTATLY